MASPTSLPLLAVDLGVVRVLTVDHVREVLEVGEASPSAGPPQSVRDKVKVLPTTSDACVNALSGCVQFLDSL